LDAKTLVYEALNRGVDNLARFGAQLMEIRTELRTTRKLVVKVNILFFLA